MNGFARDLKSAIVQLTPHLEIQSIFESKTKQEWQPLLETVSAIEGVSVASPFVRKEAMVRYSSNLQGGLALGLSYDALDRGFALPSKMTGGTVGSIEKPFTLLLGYPMLASLGASVGDSLVLISPQTNHTALGFIPRFKTVTVGGEFRSGLYAMDSSLMLMSLEAAALLFSQNKYYDGIMLWLDDAEAAPQLSARLQQELAPGYLVQDWTVRNSNLFSALSLERKVMSIILFIIIILATFNLSITLYQLVREKQTSIAILRTIGATPGFIGQVFFFYGSLLIVLGLVVGTLLGLLLASTLPDIVEFFESLFNFKILSGEVFLITKVPSQISTLDTLTIVIVTKLVSFLFLLHPAYQASTIKPHEILKHE